jgi:AraC family transcriptional regulator, regulatory protein of adaptative response / methylated-DNA-[protein]-cysteine methyltransferase
MRTQLSRMQPMSRTSPKTKRLPSSCSSLATAPSAVDPAATAAALADRFPLSSNLTARLAAFGLGRRSFRESAILDAAECERARITRDRSYDGRFFTGVRTTRIYCRPVCPVHPARAENVRFFPSAAAAETAGFRPCLRCRPETAPFSPAWNGSRTTVARALRLIMEGALDQDSVRKLASRLGVGVRHLDRLFSKHLGASPLQVARTNRVQYAKRLLDSTDLPISAIAMRAGFSSIRRFNAVFREVYRRSPSTIRKARGALHA